MESQIASNQAALVSLRTKFEEFGSNYAEGMNWLINTQLVSLEQSTERVRTNFSKLRDRVTLLEMKEETTIPVNFGANNGYQILRTDIGPIFLSVRSTEPYLDGHKLLVSLGNPSGATITGGSIQFLWHVQTEIKSQEIAILKELLPGTWTPYEFTLLKLPKESLDDLSISASITQLKLRTPIP